MRTTKGEGKTRCAAITNGQKTALDPDSTGTRPNNHPIYHLIAVSRKSNVRDLNSIVKSCQALQATSISCRTYQTSISRSESWKNTWRIDWTSSARIGVSRQVFFLSNGFYSVPTRGAKTAEKSSIIIHSPVEGNFDSFSSGHSPKYECWI